MNRKGSVAIIILLIVIIVLIIAGVWYYEAYPSSTIPTPQNKIASSPPSSNPGAISQTTQTVGTTTIVTVTDPAVANAAWIHNAYIDMSTSSALAVGGTVYQLKELPSPCTNYGAEFGNLCDEALIATANGTTTVLVPSLWNIIGSDIKTSPGRIYLIGATDKKLFIGAISYGDESQTPIGIYSFDINSKQFSQLSYMGGDWCAALSPSSPYIADEYDGSSTPVDANGNTEILSQTVQVFSLIDNAVVYSQKITAPQEVNPGGMGCQDFLWNDDGTSVTYGIENQPPNAPPVSIVKVDLP